MKQRYSNRQNSQNQPQNLYHCNSKPITFQDILLRAQQLREVQDDSNILEQQFFILDSSDNSKSFLHSQKMIMPPSQTNNKNIEINKKNCLQLIKQQTQSQLSMIFAENSHQYKRQYLVETLKAQNERLWSDNKAIFAYCLKIRKQLIKSQIQLTQYREKSIEYENKTNQNENFKRQIAYLKQQRQKIQGQIQYLKNRLQETNRITNQIINIVYAKNLPLDMKYLILLQEIQKNRSTLFVRVQSYQSTPNRNLFYSPNTTSDTNFYQNHNVNINYEDERKRLKSIIIEQEAFIKQLQRRIKL